ncbi:hypothetical protein GCM10009725_29450 [Aeromicrobium tamlense]
MATPTPVPALTTVWTRPCRSEATRCATAWARAGDTSPELAPPSRTPSTSAGVLPASAIVNVPAVAKAPAVTATPRAPSRGVSTDAASTATQ